MDSETTLTLRPKKEDGPSGTPGLVALDADDAPRRARDTWFAGAVPGDDASLFKKKGGKLGMG